MRVLLVDDNAMYRSAFRRNLALRDYEVVEAENGDDAARRFQESQPDVVITDLSMGTPREGLDVIRSIKQLDPLTPVVMISAVGTFEEGAEAHALGASRVLSKSNIEEHIEELFRAIEDGYAKGTANRAARREIEYFVNDPEAIPEGAASRLRQIAADASLHPLVRGEAYDALLLATEAELRRTSEESMPREGEGERDALMDELAKLIPALDTFSPESIKELRTAETFFRRQGDSRPKDGNDFSRNMGFSYCFAVENEAKQRLRKRLQRFLSSKQSIKIVRSLIDPTSRQLDLFFHQYLLRLQSQIPFDFTVDNVRQVLSRISEHEARYKPDGLKALGILLAFFGRDYTVRTLKEIVRIDNPLGIKSFESEMHLLRFAHLLTSLQHYRNPYIHPEISDMEKISKIRETALQCLREMHKLSQ